MSRTAYIATLYEYNDFIKLRQVRNYMIYLFKEGKIRAKVSGSGKLTKYKFFKRDTKKIYNQLRQKALSPRKKAPSQ